LLGPRSAVFTTALVKDGEILAFEKHLNRLAEHAKRLRIDLPANIEELIRNEHSSQGMQLMRIRWDGELHLSYRGAFRQRFAEAVSLPAPRWTSSVTGCKHGDWEAYRKAREAALEKGADVALLIHENAIVDAARAMPIILDEDGTLWIASKDQGGVSSITFELLRPGIIELGIPISEGKLNERLTARAREVLVVGTGIGVANISEIDGVEIGDGTTWLGDRLNEDLNRLGWANGDGHTGR